jgi:hypothetical protein
VSSHAYGLSDVRFNSSQRSDTDRASLTVLFGREIPEILNPYRSAGLDDARRDYVPCASVLIA